MVVLNVDPHRVFNVFVISCQVLCLVILFFMAPDALNYAYGLTSPNGTTFFNIVLASLGLLLSRAETEFIPKQYRIGLRSLATMLMFGFADSAVCMTYTVVSQSAVPADVKARGALRFSMAMILFCAFATFMYSYFCTLPNVRSWFGNGAASDIQKLAQILVVVFMFLSQAVGWSLDDMCNAPSVTGAVFRSVTPLLYGLLYGAGALFSDSEAYDFAFVVLTVYFYRAAPVFNTGTSSYGQDHFNSMWRAYVILQFVASIFVGLSVVIGVLIKRGLQLSYERLFVTWGIVQTAFFVVGMAGAICIYAKSASGYTGELENWQYSFAWLIPLLHMIHLITSVEYFRGVAVILSLGALATIGSSVYQSVTTSVGGGYENAGKLMSFFAILGSPVVSILLERPFGIRPIDEYFGDVFPTNAGGSTSSPQQSYCGEVSRKFFIVSAIMVYLSASSFAIGSSLYAEQLLLALYLFLGNECRLPDLHRIVFFLIVPSLFSNLLWPLSSSTNVSNFLTFFILGWFAFHYIARYPEVRLHLVSGEEDYELSTPFLASNGTAEGGKYTSPQKSLPANNGDGVYQRVPSGPTERTSLLVGGGSNQSAKPQPSHDETPVTVKESTVDSEGPSSQFNP